MARLEARADQLAARYRDLAGRRTVFQLPLTFLEWYVGRQGMLMASALAFRLFLWLMPLSLLFAGILAGIAGTDSDAAKSLAKSASISGTAADQVVTALRDGQKSWWIAVLVGGAGALWGAKSLLRSLWLVHAHTWQLTRSKPPIRSVVTTVFVFVGAWAGLLAAAAVIPRLDHLVPGGLVLAFVAEIAGSTAIWLAVTLRLPHLRATWTDLLPGAVLFGLALTILHAASRIYIPPRLKHSSEMYGALGVAGVILAWLLLMGQIIVAAALVNAAWYEHRQGVGH